METARLVEKLEIEVQHLADNRMDEVVRGVLQCWPGLPPCTFQLRCEKYHYYEKKRYALTDILCTRSWTMKEAEYAAELDMQLEAMNPYDPYADEPCGRCRTCRGTIGSRL